MNNENEGTNTVLEGIKLLKEWSYILLVVQIGAIGFIGTILKETTNNIAQCAAIICIFSFVLSILGAANLLGSLPKLAAKSNSITDFYAESGNLKIPVRLSAATQGIFFVAGIIAFAFFAMLLSDI